MFSPLKSFWLGSVGAKTGPVLSWVWASETSLVVFAHVYRAESTDFHGRSR